MTLLCYHGFNNWQNFMLEGENERDNILFGFELEATQDSDFEGNIVSPEEMAGCLKNEFGNLFVYERDSSIGCGLEIISNPMTIGWYKNNNDKFKKLLNILDNSHYVSTKGNKCGLHIHFNRKALGFNSKEYDLLLSNLNNNTQKAIRIDHERSNITIENMVSIMELYQEELIKISGRNQKSLRWCRFETPNGYEVKDIKKFAKDKRKSGGNHNDRYKVVNTTNEKTVEIRLCRGTLLWESFNSRINLMYNIVNVARNYQGLVNLEKLIVYKNDEDTIQMMKNYIENNSIERRKVALDEVTKIILLMPNNKLRPSSFLFGKYTQLQ
ncbi:Putative amidoligase enzyme [Thomasclavelia cocleata]|uniref:Putative amidoligase enzyme n=2 Tax=Thomasclavelia cocleata TaxID=69824 RepID=A0A1I0CP36_9FIRM|nr:amidoligase family protein [Thomasclavelia cocleata]MCR1960747.1 amidoligase family protein [Thomasclavelia cocleata]NDO42591.1 hypothetical protein [Thomasclavelia cocleata]SET21444.1 Putative amidoligase enzyme [Thomasclavelia cocleata]